MIRTKTIDCVVKVRFKNSNGWSPPFTYLSEIPLKRYDLVVVPTRDFFSVGKVSDSNQPDSVELSPDIEYKFVILKFERELNVSDN